MLNLFLDNLLPVFLAASVGFLLAGGRKVEPRTVAHVGFYALAPCLVFRLLVENPLNLAQMARIAGVTVTAMGLPALAAVGVSRLLGWSRKTSAAVTLTVLLPNAANLGLSVNHFAFGEEALAQAGVFFVTASIITYTVGVLVASLGRASLGQAFRELLKVPALWAVVAGLVLVGLHWKLPLPLQRAVYLLADACIPVFLLILGMQLRTVRGRGAWAPLAVIVLLRLVAGPLAGFAAAHGLGVTGPGFQAAVLESGMPVAVITLVLATEYDVEPELVTAAVLASTLLSPLTLTPLMQFLK